MPRSKYEWSQRKLSWSIKLMEKIVGHFAEIQDAYEVSNPEIAAKADMILCACNDLQEEIHNFRASY